MGTPQERREREKQELRSKILDAARALFVKHGYESVTMRKIAERIEYSPTAIYLHFKDKETLIAELCRHDFRAFGTRFLHLAKIADPIERMKKAGWAYLEFAVEHPQQYQLMFMTPQLPGTKPRAGESEDPAQNAYVFLRATVAQAMAEGRLRPELTDVDLVAQTIWAATHGVVSLEIAKCEAGWVAWRPVRRRMEAMMELCLAQLTAEKAHQKKRGR
jgi:AcrR family transcriptional regulator